MNRAYAGWSVFEREKEKECQRVIGNDSSALFVAFVKSENWPRDKSRLNIGKL